MKKLSVILVLLISLFLLNNNHLYAGKIKNLNIKATDGASVEVKTNNNNKDKNIKINKDSKSTVIIDEKKIDCEDEVNKDICKPDLF